MRKLVMVLAAAGLFATTACNTIRGAGRDVEKAGEVVQDAAK
jgi:predicted small secreted protein